jgi:hypothetical protein
VLKQHFAAAFTSRVTGFWKVIDPDFVLAEWDLCRDSLCALDVRAIDVKTDRHRSRGVCSIREFTPHGISAGIVRDLHGVTWLPNESGEV